MRDHYLSFRDPSRKIGRKFITLSIAFESSPAITLDHALFPPDESQIDPKIPSNIPLKCTKSSNNHEQKRGSMLKNDCASERLRYKIVKVTAGVLVNTYSNEETAKQNEV